MSKFSIHFPFSPVSFTASIVGALAMTYIGLIAVVMIYATYTIDFSQSVRNDESVVAKLESQYLSTVTQITNTDYVALGYAKPTMETFVPTAPATALR